MADATAVNVSPVELFRLLGETYQRLRSGTDATVLLGELYAEVRARAERERRLRESHDRLKRLLAEALEQAAGRGADVGG